jgi:hypothetical protein
MRGTISRRAATIAGVMAFAIPVGGGTAWAECDHGGTKPPAEETTTTAGDTDSGSAPSHRGGKKHHRHRHHRPPAESGSDGDAS